jgi:hypothetical protein
MNEKDEKEQFAKPLNRTAFVKAISIPNSLSSYYDDMQKDYKKFLNLFFKWAAIPYMDCKKDKNGNDLYHNEEDVIKERDFLLVKNPDVVKQFIENIKTGNQKGNSSSYNVFFEQYEERGAKFPPKIKEFFINSTKESFEISFEKLKLSYGIKEEKVSDKKGKKGENKKERNKKSLDQAQKDFNKIDLDFWKKSSAEMYGLVDKKNIENKCNLLWKEIKEKFRNPVRGSGAIIRVDYDIKCKRPQNLEYCKQLFEMIRSKLCSVYSKCVLHIKETQSLVEQKDNLVNKLNSEIFKDFISLRTYLKNNNLSFSYNFVSSCSDKIEGNSLEYNDKFYANLVISKEFEKIISYCLTRNDKKLSNFNYLKTIDDLISKLENRKKFPKFNFEHNDFGIPFGESYLGFEIDKQTVKIKEFEDFQIYKSCYFGGLEVEKKNRGYNLKFRHMRKNRKNIENSIPYGNEINAQLNQFNLRKKNGNFYLDFNYSISHPKEKFNLKSFLQGASLLEKDKLPDKIVCMAIDLNIKNPVSFCKAVFFKGDFSHPLQLLGYGSGYFIQEPQFLIADGPHNGRMVELTKSCKTLISSIRSYKIAKNTEEEFNGKLLKSLALKENKDLYLIESNNCVKENLYLSNDEDVKKYLENSKRTRNKLEQISFAIENKFKNIKSEIAKINKMFFTLGEKQNVSDMIRLLELKDTFSSLRSSFERKHLKNGEVLNSEKKFDEKRANFRKEIARKLSAQVTFEASDCDIVFVEDLSFKDDEKNRLVNLFSCNLLLDSIEMALNKRNIQMVEVNKQGTSKVDPVTGKVGYRSEKDKSKLYVERDGKVCYIDSDLAACVNVMLKGMSHSVCPYRFNLVDKKINKENKEKEDGERIKKFKSLNSLEKGINFYYSEKVISEKDHYENLDRLKKWCAENEWQEDKFIKEQLGQEETKVLPNLLCSCKAFSMINHAKVQNHAPKDGEAKA